jgi:hypothetical protein
MSRTNSIGAIPSAASIKAVSMSLQTKFTSTPPPWAASAVVDGEGMLVVAGTMVGSGATVVAVVPDRFVVLGN